MLVTILVLNLGASETFPVSRVLINLGALPFAFFKLVAPLLILPALYVLGVLRLLRILNIAMLVIVAIGTLTAIAMLWPTT
jgi:hypothetical protein